ncbi:universal stress protein [Micromonospora sp. 15K316]|uniref:universal stress protein n=1 Tax=Micromonospora sp. 15K316 TaxID=2530376 RepID=UPI00104AF128|nr:universal stress protein [Micromonospora sp. 15K316]TDC28792.1 universal stress protein [Micromonospora sp. 15K316]
MNRPVVVGVDGSPASLAAAAEAARAAARRNLPLHLLHGYLHPLGYGVPLSPYDLGLPVPSDAGQQMLERAVGELATRWPGVHIEARQLAGGPGAALVEESQRAELVVVGSRGLGGFGGLLLGSVSAQVVAHAHCPVLVVRGADGPVPERGPVLVGVDGSESAELAVRYAAEEAARREAELVLVHAEEGRHPESAGGVPPEEEPSTLLASAAAAARDGHPDLAVTARTVRARSAEQALIEASREAALMVVGTRGRGGFVGMLLGSVSQALVHHAHCSVLVAHAYDRAG